MFGKIKRVFFTGIFGVLYISFLGQLVYILGWLDGVENKLVALAALSIEWLVLISARYLSKRSSGNAQQHGGFRRH